MKNIIYFLSILSILVNCSESDSDYIFTLFEEEIQYYAHSGNTYYFEKSREYFVGYYFGLIPNKILVFKNYALLDSSKNVIKNLHLWREGALKEHHGDVLIFSIFTYERFLDEGTKIKVTNEESWYSIWYPRFETELIEIRNFDGFLIAKKYYSQRDTIDKSFVSNTHSNIDFVLSKEGLYYDIVDVKLDNQVIVMQRGGTLNIHVFNHTTIDSLNYLFKNQTFVFVFYYDKNYKLMSEYYIERGKVIRTRRYEYTINGNKNIIKEYNEKNQIKGYKIKELIEL